jgi:hypothetical protein
MIRIKTLSLPLITALFASAAVPLNAQLTMELSSEKVYRQYKDSDGFRGGNFNVFFTDGMVTSLPGCNWLQYYPPGYFGGLCAQGTSAFLTSGELNGATMDFPYLLVTGISPAQVVAPREAGRVKLSAAPASTLQRGSVFEDDSVSLYYNLHTATNLREYVLTRYNATYSYGKNQLAKFNSDIVPGVYHYSFPRIGNPRMSAIIKATVFPMGDYSAKNNNKVEGFKFLQVNNNKWTKDGFIELSYLRPNVVKWNPLSASTTYGGGDSMFFSIRVIKDQKNPKSNTVVVDRYSERLQSVFPDFTTDGDPRVSMASPLVSQFNIPPLMAGGTRGMIEVELKRNIQTGVTYDFSSRKFQTPVVVVNRYSEYADISFPNSNAKADLLKDADGDGYNNLNEWILDSGADNPNSIPVGPIPEFVDTVYDFDSFGYYFYFGYYRLVRPAYFGFTISKKLNTRPGVVYTLQRSKDNGRTWQKFESDDNWTVTTVNLAPGMGSVKANSPRRVEIRVESKPWTEIVADEDGFLSYITHYNEQPPGTQYDIYRVKVTLAKSLAK